MRHTLIALVENKPGVLNRVASLFRRRNFNIDSLNVGRTEDPRFSRMTITVDSIDDSAYRAETNLYKLVNVVDVQEALPGRSLLVELALIKVAATPDRRQEVLSLAQIFDARIEDVGPDSLIVQFTSNSEKIDSLIEALRPCGIIELVRTGNVAMMRGRDEGIRHTPGAGAAVTHLNGNHVTAGEI